MNKIDRAHTAPPHAVHKSIAHESAARHVSGSAIYVDDAKQPEGLLQGWVIASERAHARLLSIDLAAVKAAPGVVCVLTAADIPGMNDAGPILAGEPLLAAGVVTYAGEPIAIIAAKTLAQARDAAALAVINYEDLPAILSIDAARAAESYVVPPMRLARGDAATAIAAAPHRLRGQASAGGQDHFYLETQISMAEPGEDNAFHVLSSTQHPTEVQHIVARLDRKSTRLNSSHCA